MRSLLFITFALGCDSGTAAPPDLLTPNLLTQDLLTQDKDITPPTTTASPSGGIGHLAVSVTLTCSDSGSGCAHTYYTTDGSEPSATSLVNGAPIAFSASTMLRFFSVDNAGNAEAAKSEMYLIETVAPTVTASAPAAFDRQVAPSAVVSVTFSEAMDPSSLATSVVLDPPVAATVTWDAASLTATLTPGNALATATRYTIRVDATATDLAGNGLAAPFAASFRTVPRAEIRVDDGGAALQEPDAIAFNDLGNGMLVFERPGQLMYSLYTATDGTWSTPVVLRSWDNNYDRAAVVANQVSSGKQTFVVHISGLFIGSWVETFTFDPAGTPKWSGPAEMQLDIECPPVGRACTAATVAGPQIGLFFINDTEVHALFHDGTAWGAPSVDLSGLGESMWEIDAASDGSSSAIAWRQGNPGALTTILDYYSVLVAGGWTAAARIDPGNSASYVDQVGVVGSDGVYLLAVASNTAPLKTGRYLVASQTAEALVNVSSVSAPQFSLAVRSGEYAMAWIEGSVGERAWVSTSFDGSWAPPTQLTANAAQYRVRTLANAGGFLVAVETSDGGGAGQGTTDVMAEVYSPSPSPSPGNWGSLVELKGPSTLVDQAAYAGSDAGYLIAYRELTQNGAPRLYYRRHAGGSWQPATRLDDATGTAGYAVTAANGASFAAAWSKDDTVSALAGLSSAPSDLAAPVSGSVFDPRIVTAGDDRGLIAWVEESGGANAIMARPFQTGVLGGSFLVKGGIYPGITVGLQLAAAGAQIGIAYAIYDRLSTSTVVGARVYDGATLSSDTTFAAAAAGFALVVRGSDLVLAWTRDTGSGWVAEAALYSSGAWQPVDTLGAAAAQSSLRAVGSPANAAVGWTGASGSSVAVLTNSGWSTADLPSSGATPFFGSDGADLLAVAQTASGTNAYLWNGAWPQSPTQLRDTSVAGSVRIASVASGRFAVAWRRANGDSEVGLLENSTWGTTTTVLSTAYNPEIRPTGDGYFVIAQDQNTDEVGAAVYSAGAWSSATSLGGLYHTGGFAGASSPVDGVVLIETPGMQIEEHRWEGGTWRSPVPQATFEDNLQTSVVGDGNRYHAVSQRRVAGQSQVRAIPGF